MAKFVIAGRCDCPYYARVELLGDRLVKNLSSFHLHKIVKTPSEWQTWLDTTCEERGWHHKTSPIIWRELIDRGGKGVLIGGASDFQEYVKGYYGLESDLTSHNMRLIAEENCKTKLETDTEEAAIRALSNPIHVCLTAAGSPTVYSLIDSIASGQVFGHNTEIYIHLYDDNPNMSTIEGLKMEIQDLCCGVLRGVESAMSIEEAFKDCSIIILTDEIAQAKDESFEQWIDRNAQYFGRYASVINTVARKNVRVLLAGSGPINFNTFIMIQNAPSIPRQNFVALSRLVENQAKSILAERLKVNTAGVVDVIVWGNINGSNFIDVTKARVHGYNGAIWGPPSFSVSVMEMVYDNKWLEEEYLKQLGQRTEVVEAMVKHESTLSKARAIVTMLDHWWNGSPLGQVFSLGVCSEGWYGVPDGLVFSYPVVLSPRGYWTVVQDIELTDEIKEKLQEPIKDLLREKEVVYPPPYVPPSDEPGSRQSAEGDEQTEEAPAVDEPSDIQDAVDEPSDIQDEKPLQEEVGNEENTDDQQEATTDIETNQQEDSTHNEEPDEPDS